jgi:predicted flap endonuclease-1-like 5' DNA nuclease
MGTVGWIIIVVVALALGILIGWLIWGRQAKAQGERIRELEGTLSRRESRIRDLEADAEAAKAQAAEQEASLRTAQVALADAEAAAVAPPDDLTLIEGIGPKVQSLLQGAGIRLFGQLAKADLEGLQELVRAAGMAMMDPSSWPEQAQLAAEGKTDELAKLQEELKGGRRE